LLARGAHLGAFLVLSCSLSHTTVSTEPSSHKLASITQIYCVILHYPNSRSMRLCVLSGGQRGAEGKA